MTTTQVHTPIDTHDMVLVHRALRREFRLLPLMIEAAGRTGNAQAIAAHARELVAVLHHHHAGEDELLWPKLRERAPLDTPLLQRMESQHELLGALLEAVEPTLAVWVKSPMDQHTQQLTDLFSDISLHLNVHLVEEEEEALPLAARFLQPQEWGELGRRGMASLPKARSLVFLGYILEEASRTEAKAFLEHVPPPVRVLYTLIGRPRFRRESRHLRAGISDD